MKKAPADDMYNLAGKKPIFNKLGSKQTAGSRQVTAVVRFRENRVLQCILSFFIIFFIITSISPVDRPDWLLENILTFLFFGILVVTYRQFQFSNLSYFLIAVFLSLHAVGAQYSYITPLGEWLMEVFGFSRNHYDRIVHFSFGMLITYPIWELMVRATKIHKFTAYFMSPIIILAVSAFYELIEMWVAVISEPELGALFLGSQGDVWDAQRDMALALYGSILSILITVLLKRIYHRNF